MPDIQLANARYHYLEAGPDTPGQTIVFAHGLLWSGRMFDQQIKHLKDRYRCIALDFRGQGRSEITSDGYDLDTLCSDVIDLIEKLGEPPVHYVGLSMGGMVGMRLAVRRPELLRSMSLLNTSAGPEAPETLGKNRLLAIVARLIGLRPVVGQTMPVMFGASTLNDPSRADELKRWRQWLSSNDKRGIHRAASAVFSRPAIDDLLPRINVPTQMLIGSEDIPTPPARGQEIVAGIPGCQAVIIDHSGHSSTLEQPGQVNQALDAFVTQHS